MQQGDQQAIECHVDIEISDNNMVVMGNFILTPETPCPCTVQELLDLLAQRKIVYGIISQDALDHMLRSLHGPANGLILAQGDMPVESTNDKLELFFDINKTPIPQEQPDGTVDYKELGVLQNAVAGQVLAKRIVGVPGQVGKDVFGRVISVKPPLPIVLASRASKGTTVTADAMEIIAALDGQILYQDNRKISIVPVLHISNNVDFSTGNINFLGSVVVHENVLSGFCVQATGNIEIYGIIEAASLIAQGDILVRGGVQGANHSHIEAGGTIHALYLQNAAVSALGDVIVSDSIMHSVVKARSVQVTGRRGLLVGGEITALSHVFARVIGSPLATKTVIRLEPSSELGNRLHQIEDEMLQKQRVIQKVLEATAAFQEVVKKQGKLSKEQQSLVARLRPTMDEAMVALRDLEEEREEVVTLMAQLTKPYLQITRLMHPGVRVDGYCGEFICEENTGPCTILLTEHGWQKQLR